MTGWWGHWIEGPRKVEVLLELGFQKEGVGEIGRMGSDLGGREVRGMPGRAWGQRLRRGRGGQPQWR